MQVNEKLYNITESIHNDIKNIGYDYEGSVLKNNTSSYLLKNSTISGFINKLEPIIDEIIGLPKKLKSFWCYTTPKDYKNMN